MFPPAEAGACIITKRVVLNNFALHKLIHSIDKSPIMPKCDNLSFFSLSQMWWIIHTRWSERNILNVQNKERNGQKAWSAPTPWDKPFLYIKTYKSLEKH